MDAGAIVVLPQVPVENSVAILKEILDRSRDAIAIASPEGIHYFQNKAFDRLFGCIINPASPIAQYVDAAVGRKVFETIMAGREWTGEAELYGQNRQVLFIQLHAYPIRGQDGRILALVGIHTDITGHRTSEAELSESRKRWYDMMENIPMGMFQSTPEGKFLYVNPYISSMLGYHSPQELIAEVNRTSIAKALYEDSSRRPAFVDQVEAGGGTWRIFENRYRKKDGSIIDAILTFHERQDPLTGAPILYGFVQDITMRKQMEAKIRQSEKMSAIGQLAAGVAHDFNNHLSIILAAIEALLDELGNEEARTDAIAIRSATEQAMQLTRTLLAFGRKDRNVIEPVNLHLLLEGVMTMLRRSIDKRIVINGDLRADQDIIEGDQGQLFNAFLNLGINASDAMPSGGKMTFTSENIRHAPASSRSNTQGGLAFANFIRVRVQDTGTGIPPEILNHIFEPFFTTKAEGKGTGLGLATTYGIVNNHRGTIAVESRVGEGTTFEILLPIFS